MLSIITGLSGLIPILGPLIQGVSGIVSTISNAKVQTLQTEAGVATAGMQATNQLVLAFANDAAVRACRDIIMFPGSIYCGTYIWDRWIEIQYPSLVWGVKSLEGPLAYLPFALLTFFFGAAFVYFNPWKQK